MASSTLLKRRRHKPAQRPLPAEPKGLVVDRRADTAAGRRIASNFAFLSLAELVCRGTSVVVTLSLTQRLGKEGYGRIEFAFNIVFWLVLLIRDSSDVMAARELSRHPRLIKPLVDNVLAIKGLLSLILFSGLAIVGALSLRDPGDWQILALYGLMLFTTASGLDFVYRGTECMGLLAISLTLRTSIYAVGVLAWVNDPSRILWVPTWLALGEATGIALVWLHYLKTYRLPRPRLGLRFVGLILQRGRTVCLIQLSQAVIITADFLVVGLLSSWSDLGTYAAPHRLVTAILTFGLILQQAAFPTLSRLWRQTACVGRTALDLLVEIQITVLVPIAVGGTILAEPIVRALFPADFAGAGLLLAIGIWRAPLLILAFLYQTALIALNREIVGVRSLLMAAMGIGPLVMLMKLSFGLPGAIAAVLLLGLALVAGGYASLAREGRQPAWHHHLARPVAASLAMIPACMVIRNQHVSISILCGALTYAAVWLLLGGLDRMQVWRLAFRSLPSKGRAA